MAPKKENRRVLVIGLDGATPDLLMQWVREGKLPAFAKLIDDGVSGTLKSTIPPLTCPAWLSFITGKNPGKLGVYGFFDRKPDTYKITYAVNFQSIDSQTFWDILGERGKKVGIFSVPTTFPPRKVNGFIVSGWPIPQGAIFTYPSDLESKLNIYAGQRTGTDRTIHMATWRWYSAEDKFLEGLDRFTEWEVRATKYLMNNYDWDLFMTVFSGIDSIQHFFWKHMDEKHPLHNPDDAEKYGKAILKYYQRMDNILKELLDSASGDTRVIIMSDHGFGPYHNIFNVNDWLNKEGFLKAQKKDRESSVNWLPTFFQSTEQLFNSLTKLEHKLGLLKIYYFITDHSSISRALANRIRGLLKIETYPSFVEIPADWPNTKAYSLGAGIAGRIYVNLRGREPQGIIKPGKEYEELRNRLIEELRSLRDPKTNEKVDVDIFKREEIYHGEHFDHAPDLIFFVNKGRTRVDGTFGHEDTFTYDLSTKRDNAAHRMNGILIMKGPEIRKGKKGAQAEITDIAPTILYMMGCPIPSDMDGKVLTDAFDSSHLKSNPIKYQEVTGKPTETKFEWSKEEQERIKKRLEALGYL